MHIKLMDQNQISTYLSNEINKTLATGSFTDFSDKLFPSVQLMEAGASKELYLSVINLYASLKEGKEFITDLACGKLSSEVPARNNLLSSFKQLHANLSHLVWQVKQLSEGDLEQKVDFLGDFSIYFNRLIKSLKEKREIENKLKQSSEKYRVAIENANIGIITVDVTGKIQTTNKECVHIFGYSQAEMETMSINEITLPKDHHISLDFINQAVGDRNHSKAEFIKRYIHKSGKIVTCQISSSLMYDEQGKPLFFMSHIKDITRRIESAKALKELNVKLSETVNKLKQSNAAKVKLFRIIAHDLKNHFNAIMGFSEFLYENVHTDSPDEIEMQASIIYQSSQNAYKLLENLLDWAMSQTGRIAFSPQQLTFENILKEVLEFTAAHAESKGITISYSLNGASEVYADANMLRTILRNLIGNAIKFTGEKGEIKINMQQAGKETLITVSDTGMGIAQENVEKLFVLDEMISIPDEDAPKGTGLGLLLCKEFVDKHGGKIWIESVPGKGSDFKFTLPAMP
ncbi:MAG: ATP-binding protein [Lentimicrobium sp.]|jgi:PAS domain S-box-containing protein|nr:ATP-binding protein [Lentimicrobium sp.]